MTAKQYMLDTNVISALLRRPHGAVAGRVRRQEGAVCTSIIVAAALRFGCAKRGGSAFLRRVDALLSEIGVLAFEAPADAEYGRLRFELEASGRVIGANDLFIAAHARCLDLVLVTANIGEFSLVPGLKVETWVGA